MPGSQGADEVSAALVVMHNRSRPKDVVQETRLGGRYVGVEHKDLLSEIVAEPQVSVDLALHEGVAEERLIVDPGLLGLV